MIPAAAVFDALQVTWPPARTLRRGAVAIREGRGGGSRVSCATTDAVPSLAELRAAEADMRSLGQPPLFMVRAAEDDLDDLLAQQGYKKMDPTLLLAIRVADLQSETPAPRWPPDADQIALWHAAGVGPDRIAVMQRVTGPKAALRGVDGAATAFVARHGDQVMLHALEVAPEHRRRGLGRRVVQEAAGWAGPGGWLTLAVTRANAAARALYASLGMREAGRYHYRIRKTA